MIAHLFAQVLLVLLIIADARADLVTASRTFEAEDYGTAYRAYDPLARASDVEAQYWMDHLLDGAYCGEEDPEHVNVCLLKAAKQAAADFEPMMTITQLTEIAPSAGAEQTTTTCFAGPFVDLGAARRGVPSGEHRAHGD